MEPGVTPNPAPSTNQDEEQLRMLSIFFLIYAALQAVGMCCAGGYFFLIGGALAAGTVQGGAGAPPAAVGGIFGGMGVFIMLICGAMAFLHYTASKALKERRSTTLIYVAAVLACLSFPIGTALGVFTFIVLSRPSVKALFSS